MNLVEVSEITEITIEELREILLNEFNRIVLSDYSQVDERVLKRLMDYLQIDLNVCDSDYEEEDEDQVDCDNEVSDAFGSPEEECLKELELLSYPEIEYTKNLLEYCMNNKYLIFIDTCSLLNDNFYLFYGLFVQVAKPPTTLYVPYVVKEELMNMLQKKEKEHCVLQKVEDRINFIVEQCKLGKIKIVGDENDKRTNERGEKVIHADRVIIEKLIYFRNDSKNCLLITQDHGVTADALKQNDWQSTKSHALILVKKIGKGGVLVDNTEGDTNPKLPIDK